MDRHYHHQRSSDRGGGSSGYSKHHISHAYHYQQPQHHHHHQPPPLPYGHHHQQHHHHQHNHSMHLAGVRPARGEYYQSTALYHTNRHHVSAGGADYGSIGAVTSEIELQRRAKKYSYEQPKDAESLEQDLRSRLLSKRNNYVKDYEMETNYEHKSSSRKESRLRGEERLLKAERHKQRHERSARANVIEVLDSPEPGDGAKSRHKQRSKQLDKERVRATAAGVRLEPARNRTGDDPELTVRREKLLAAEREIQKRKQTAREELEARRELLRERNEHNALSPSAVAASVTAGLNVVVKRKQKSDQYEHEVKHKKRSKHSHDEQRTEDDENESEESDSESEEDEDDEDDDESAGTATGSETGSDESDGNYEQTKKRKRPSDADAQAEEDVPLPDSPLSVGELYKSPKQRKNRKKRTPSISSRSSRSSRSPSRSESHSRSESAGSRSRSRSPGSSPDERAISDQCSPSTSTRSEERGMAQNQAKLNDVEEKTKHIKAEDAPICDDKGVPLPNYFPGVQGCRSVEEFQCLNRIEEGTYGVVYRAKDKRTSEIVALKRLKMEKEKEGFPITSLREINTLLKGQHPNIVTVREIVVGSNMDKIFIVMDYVEHDLKSLMETMKNRKQSFFPGEVKCLTQQLLLAVAHLHDNWILHRDLKTSNLLLSHKGILKVGDFGLAREYGSPLKKYTSLVVTLWYRAPELLLCSPEYSTPIDVWSVGCIFAEFLQMSPLFPGKSEIDELNRIFKELGTPNDKIWPGYNELPAVKNMLSQNSQFTEYPVSQLRKHFQDKTSDTGVALLQGLLTYDPKQRLTADGALKHPYFKELPLPIDPSMFPTWPAKSELGARKAQASSPKPPSGGSQFKQLGRDEPIVASSGGGVGAKLSSGIITGNKKSGASTTNTGFVLNAGLTQRQLAMGPGFSLKF
ncbi:serine/threonine-protein kinase PITSLRE isoform X2 [Scaptodrosophila lebanonensis]|nr:serine/threonine-protein kinase PITSLRE isoform X2 [Scaptodrosophila lebanonensis]XP_030387915.1 serine/threonine-protein kinase PITSLRE isoform X2 [Scaptodrosophila lebanonensis]